MGRYRRTFVVVVTISWIPACAEMTRFDDNLCHRMGHATHQTQIFMTLYLTGNALSFTPSQPVVSGIK
jgi:hypothetical protein